MSQLSTHDTTIWSTLITTIVKAVERTYFSACDRSYCATFLSTEQPTNAETFITAKFPAIHVSKSTTDRATIDRAVHAAFRHAVFATITSTELPTYCCTSKSAYIATFFSTICATE
jgi:hypothetical protein